MTYAAYVISLFTKDARHLFTFCRVTIHADAAVADLMRFAV